MNPIQSLITAIRDNPGVEIEQNADDSILVDVPGSDGCFRIILEGDHPESEFKVTRVVPMIGGGGRYNAVAVCWIKSRALSKAIAARIIANENAAQDDLIGLVKPVEEVLKGL